MTTRHRLAMLFFACALLAAAHASAQQPDGGTWAPPPAEDAGNVAQVSPEGAGGTSAPTAHETVCNDRRDDDADGMVDCADADCFHDAACESGGAQENTDERCSDWIDNDGDGQIDCDDDDCQGSGVTRCQGSWHGGAGGGGQGGGAALGTPGGEDIPDLEPNQSVEDLIGTHGDLDGERSDEVCADGIDNDGDGRTDCQDFGCRFDPSVTVCAPTPSLRFSAFAGVALEYLRDEVSSAARAMGIANPSDGFDANFSRVELRVLGPLPFIQNSFFLISTRLENTPRLVFAMFQVPLGNTGHYLNVNSGSGTLSVNLVSGARRQLLLTPAYYMYNAYEQGNGAAAEVGGPITTDGRLQYRVFAAGGSGQFNGNVGGRFFRADNTNFTYTGGAEVQLNILGRYSRYDTPFRWEEARTPTIALLAGGKWDQRAQERYVAWYGYGVVRAWRFELRAETYGKSEFAYNYGAASWNAELAFLIVDKLLLLGADVGGFYPGSPTVPGGFGSSTIARPIGEFEYRIALHLNLFREMVRLSLLWDDHYWAANPDPGHAADTVHEQRVHLEIQYMF